MPQRPRIEIPIDLNRRSVAFLYICFAIVAILFGAVVSELIVTGLLDEWYSGFALAVAGWLFVGWSVAAFRWAGKAAIDESGIRELRVLSRTRHVPWEEIAGVEEKIYNMGTGANSRRLVVELKRRDGKRPLAYGSGMRNAEMLYRAADLASRGQREALGELIRRYGVRSRMRIRYAPPLAILAIAIAFFSVYQYARAVEREDLSELRRIGDLDREVAIPKFAEIAEDEGRSTRVRCTAHRRIVSRYLGSLDFDAAHGSCEWLHAHDCDFLPERIEIDCLYTEKLIAASEALAADRPELALDHLEFYGSGPDAYWEYGLWIRALRRAELTTRAEAIARECASRWDSETGTGAMCREELDRLGSEPE